MNIAVLLSGGVDSTIALAELVRAGYTPTAFYLKIWLEDELAYLGECPWQEDLAYAQQVCAQFGVPLEVVNLQRAYWDIVVAHTIDRIKAGKTPNPDILCNQYVKFGAFVDQVGDAWDYIASGHYAKVTHPDRRSTSLNASTSSARAGMSGAGSCGGFSRLWLTPDPVKDQTYFLSRLTQKQLAKALFPLGEYTKEQVRARAAELGVATASRKDSQGICFLGKLSFKDFIRHHLGTQTGPLVEAETGRIVGEHEGYWFYTIGQRQGIGLAGGPWYVVAKDCAHNRVLISKNYYDPAHERSDVFLEDVHWLADARPEIAHVRVKLRHGPKMVDAQVHHNLAAGTAHVTLANRDQGIAPGQYAVLYTAEGECFASGVIGQQPHEVSV